MTNRYDNWSRLLKVIERFGKSINSFAAQIGLSRAENIYHIQKGNYGISEDLADRIIKCDPEIDRTWLLTGVGNMLKNEPLVGETLPFYIGDIETTLPNITNITPSGNIQMPYKTNADLVVRSFSKSMNETVSVAHDLFLKQVPVESVVQGNEYALILKNPDTCVVWRRIRWVARDCNRWRLVSRNREEYPDIYIDRFNVLKAWRVIARLAVLES